MPTASRQVRKLRRLKRDRSLVIKYAKQLQAQRDQVVTLYNDLLTKVKAANAAAEAKAEPKPPSFTMEVLPDEPEVSKVI